MSTRPESTTRRIGRPRLRVAVRNQMEWRPSSLEELVQSDHEVRDVWDFVCGLDLGEFLEQIEAVEGVKGRDSTDPRILLTLWIYATFKGVGSARELNRLCQEHVVYMWICGGVSLNHTTLAKFRSSHGERLKTLLKNIVASLMNEGLVSMDRVAQDGMRVRASAGMSSFRRRRTLEKCLEEAEAQVEALEKELEETPDEIDRRRRAARERGARERKERVEEALRQQKELEEKREKRRKGSGKEARASTTDPEARNMKFANGGYHPGHNVQFCTDTSSGVIVGVDVTNSGNDMGQILPMAAKLEAAYGKLPKEWLADGGFTKLEDIDDLETNHGTTVYAPVKDKEKKLEAGLDPYAPRKRDTEATAAWRARMSTDDAKKIYRERAGVAEWVNAICRNCNLWFFPVRGLRKSRAVATLYALAHNVRQAIKLRKSALAASREV